MDVTDVAFLTLPSESKIKIKAQERFDIQLKTNKLLLGGPWRGGSQKGALLMGGSVRAANKFTVKVQEKKLLSLPH